HPGIDGDQSLLDDVPKIARVVEDLGELARLGLDIGPRRKLGAVRQSRDEGADEILFLLALARAHANSSSTKLSTTCMLASKSRVDLTISRNSVAPTAASSAKATRRARSRSSVPASSCGAW